MLSVFTSCKMQLASIHFQTQPYQQILKVFRYNICTISSIFHFNAFYMSLAIDQIDTVPKLRDFEGFEQLFVIC